MPLDIPKCETAKNPGGEPLVITQGHMSNEPWKRTQHPYLEFRRSYIDQHMTRHPK
jgi:hypothetical protein